MTLFLLTALANDGLVAGTERQRSAIARCLANWKDHPFGENPKFKQAALTVRVLQFNDTHKVDEPTEAPQLVYIEPNVNVLSKVTYALTNPNGWYCLNNNVDVLSKIRFDMHCEGRLTASRDTTTVLGADDVEKGITVLGSVRIERSCEPTPEPEKPKHFYPSK